MGKFQKILNLAQLIGWLGVLALLLSLAVLFTCVEFVGKRVSGRAASWPARLGLVLLVCGTVGALVAALELSVVFLLFRVPFDFTEVLLLGSAPGAVAGLLLGLDLALRRTPSGQDQKGPSTHPPCPRCGFGYKWDGSRCGHCGHSEQPSIKENTPGASGN